MTDVLDEKIRRIVAELVEAAPTAPPLPRAPGPDTAPAQTHRGRRLVPIAAALLVAAAVGYGVVQRKENARPSSTHVTTRPSVPTTPPTTQPGPSAKQLASGTWATIPTAPVALGHQAAVVWTGSRLIVWGGSTARRPESPMGAGAAYDPATDTWTVLPKAPISARWLPAATWTGTEMLVWGGYDQLAPQLHVADDGAAYNPATNTWRVLSPTPLPAQWGAQAIWTGREAVIFGGAPAVMTDAMRVYPEVAAYDPATDRWRSLDPVPSRPGQGLFDLDSVWTGSEVLTLMNWASSSSADRSISYSYGVRIAVLDPSTGTWRDQATPSELGGSARNPLWVGSGVLAQLGECIPCHGPGSPLGIPTFSLEPESGAYRLLAMDRLGPNARGADAWTGRALVRLVSGGAAAWDPATDAWTRLPTPPTATTDVLVWTGDQLLAWGTEPGSNGPVGGMRYRPTP